MLLRGRSTHLAALMAGLALVACLAAEGELAAQSQPKFPVPLPVPKTPAAQPAPSGTPAGQPPVAPSAPSPAPAGPRDPFEPLVKKPTPGEERRLQEITGLRLVGVIWDAADREQIRALVETADGLGYYLRVNEEKFGGKVVAIDRDRVQFSVREQDPGGPSRTRTVELRLPKPDAQ